MLSSSVIFTTTTSSPVQDHSQASALAQERRRRFWLERDSLTKRNQLLVGNEGSRRRQRWDNNNFTDHPFAKLNPADLRPPGYAERPKFHWTDDEAIANVTSDDIDRACRSMELPPFSHTEDPHPLQRSVRHDLKKSHIPQGLVAFYDEQIRQFMERSIVKDVDSLEQDWVIVDESAKSQPTETAPSSEVIPQSKEHSVYLVWEIGDRFSRWIVHTMSQFYNLSSFSEYLTLPNARPPRVHCILNLCATGTTTQDQRRLTYVCYPEHAEHLTKFTLEGKAELDSSSLPSPIVNTTPDKSFYSYLFR